MVCTQRDLVKYYLLLGTGAIPEYLYCGPQKKILVHGNDKSTVVGHLSARLDQRENAWYKDEICL